MYCLYIYIDEYNHTIIGIDMFICVYIYINIYPYDILDTIDI